MSGRKIGLATIGLVGSLGLIAAGLGLLWLAIFYWGPRAAAAGLPGNLFLGVFAGIFLVAGIGAFMGIFALLGGIGRTWNRPAVVT